MTESLDLADIRRMPVPDAIRWLGEHDEPADPRDDVDTASLVRRFPRLGEVVTTELIVEGKHGSVPVRAYLDPKATPSGRGLVWVHGGAFIGGTLDMPESNWVALELAARGIPVLAVDYTKCLRDVNYPVPSDDVLAAWAFALEASERLLGVEPHQLALGGASAGGALTAGAVTRLRDAGKTLPAALVLVYPVLHPNGPAASAGLDTDSPAGLLSLNYAGSVEALADPHVFAGLGDGHEFPSTLIVVCESDDLRASGESFAVALLAAGRRVTLYTESGAGHGHIDHPGDEGALKTLDAITHWLTNPDSE